MRKTLLVLALAATAACGKDKNATSNPSSDTDPAVASNPNVFNGPTIATQGRYVSLTGGAQEFAWAGSRITTRVKGATSVALNLVTANLYEKIPCFMNVSIDGGAPTTFAVDLNQTTKSYPVSLPDTSDHQITWTKITDAASCQLNFSGISLPGGGTLEATSEPPNRHIEFIGDSITNGYGVLGSMAGSGNLPYCNGNSRNSSSDLSFAKLTADALYADYTIIAMNGRGLAINSDGNGTTSHGAGDPNNAYNVMPAMFLDAVPPLAGSTSALTPQKWDATKYTPDIVVINLGTNDFSNYHFNNPACASSPSATSCNPTVAQYVTPYVAFLQTVRTTYPTAHILLLNSVMLSDNSPVGGSQFTTQDAYLKQVVSTFADANTSYHKFAGPQDTSQPVGCDYHPSASTQASMGAEVAEAIKSVMGWQ